MLFSPVAMHIPDGFLSGWVVAFLWMTSIIVVGYALKRVGRIWMKARCH
jgi:ABC-type Co2+ transport system permease subunit